MSHPAHVQECVFFGVNPLSEKDIRRLQKEGVTSLKGWYSVACDLAAGFTWRQSVNAAKDKF